MRLVSLNTWKCDGEYSRRLAAMEAGLGALAADVILLQEDFWAPDFDLHTAGRLGDALGLSCHSVPLRKKDRVVEGAVVRSFSGLSVLSRFPVLWNRTIDLPTHPDDGERSSQAVCLESSAGPLLVINLHLTHLSEAGELRRKQLAATLEAPRGGTFSAAWWSAAISTQAPMALGLPKMTVSPMCVACWMSSTSPHCRTARPVSIIS